MTDDDPGVAWVGIGAWKSKVSRCRMDPRQPLALVLQQGAFITPFHLLPTADCQLGSMRLDGSPCNIRHVWIHAYRNGWNDETGKRRMPYAESPTAVDHLNAVPIRGDGGIDIPTAASSSQANRVRMSRGASTRLQGLACAHCLPPREHEQLPKALQIPRHAGSTWRETCSAILGERSTSLPCQQA